MELESTLSAEYVDRKDFDSSSEELSVQIYRTMQQTQKDIKHTNVSKLKHVAINYNIKASRSRLYTQVSFLLYSRLYVHGQVLYELVH